ncbi:MAG: hypothetical protein IJ274_00060 [Lachnospiraceae bacterium]|nr:hypothetical protein [Lachnospiraceae bacterium]
MAGLTEKLANYVCDKLCRFPYEITDETEMQNKCGRCEINKFLDQIQEAYDKINDFNNTQLAKLMKEHRKIVLCKNCAFRKDDTDCQGTDFSWCRLVTGIDGHIGDYDGCSRGKDIRRIMEEEDDSERDD